MYACLRARDRAADSRFLILRSLRRSPPVPPCPSSCRSARYSTSCSSARRAEESAAAPGQRPLPPPVVCPHTSCSASPCRGSMLCWYMCLES
uniref:Uncharacterized protein n=1 Tax=Arundo donax TaxID=35708 RepID=A0A0A9EKD4_ARUDO